ncbi:hypothetical protein SDC9_178536 [bioreactor metagenome]|uniref:Uncharacterized protein n=1 Tax=bioreactor metagenome TaxID=1076179 RepID=A0A645H5E1_9ZZZZ
MQPGKAADHGQRHHAQHQQRLAQIAELAEQQHQHDAQRQWQDDQQPCLGTLQVLELAAPLDMDLLVVVLEPGIESLMRILEEAC